MKIATQAECEAALAQSEALVRYTPDKTPEAIALSCAEDATKRPPTAEVPFTGVVSGARRALASNFWSETFSMSDASLSIAAGSTRFDKCKPLTIDAHWHFLAALVHVPKKYQIIGRVRQGMAFGILAIAPDGGYVRINGHSIESLGEDRTRRMLPQLERAKTSNEQFTYKRAAESLLTDQAAMQTELRPLAVVTVRKRRTIQKES